MRGRRIPRRRYHAMQCLLTHNDRRARRGAAEGHGCLCARARIYELLYIVEARYR